MPTRPLTDDEVKRFFDVIPEKKIMFRVLFYLLLTTGLRINEARTIQWNALWDAAKNAPKTILIRPRRMVKNGRGNKARAVQNKEKDMSPKMLELITTFRAALDPLPAPTDYVFISNRYKKTKKPISYRRIEFVQQQMIKRAGIESGPNLRSTHVWRKTFCHDTYKELKSEKQGAHDTSIMRDLQKAMDHQSLEATQFYLESDSKMISKVISKDKHSI
jgi:integrase